MRYLVSPVTAAFAADALGDLRRDGRVLALGPDVPFADATSWADLRFPDGWTPDGLLVFLDDFRLPPWVWAVPVPLVGLALDGDLLASYLRHVAPLCDVVLAEPPVSAGLANLLGPRLRPADLSGLAASAYDPPADPPARDIDVLVIDPLHPAARRERRAWVGRVAQLADQLRVVVRPPGDAAEDRGWLRRAKVVAIPPSPGGDRLTYEAIAAGAVPVRMSMPWDAADGGLRPNLDFIPYTPANLEAVLRDAVARDADRRAVAATAAGRVRDWRFGDRLLAALRPLEADRGTLQNLAARRSRANPSPSWGAGVWAAVLGDVPAAWPADVDPTDRAMLAAAKGLFADPPAAVAHFQESLRLAADQPAVEANLAEALAAAGQLEEAAAAARSALDHVESASRGRTPAPWDVPPYPPTNRVALDGWTAAVWAAGDAVAEVELKRTVLRWRLHLLLARLTGDPTHLHLAALARPDEPVGRAALGCALAAAGRVADALPQLRAAVALDPFDRQAVRALATALEEIGDGVGRRLFARQIRYLAAVAPAACPPEPWFAETGPVGDELVSVIAVVPLLTEAARDALDAVIRFTRRPAELIVVNTGSDDATRTALRGLSEVVFPSRAVTLEVGPLGFAAAVNRGLAACLGTFVAILDSRTLVEPGWLESLTTAVADDWPRVGLAAWPAGLLAHRAAVERVGLLDEEFDTSAAAFRDWAWKAERVGFRTAGELIGNPTGRDVDRLRQRWPAANVRLRPAGGLARRPRVSLTMIVRDEEGHLPAALESARDLFDEIIVVDTGSTDATRSLAAAAGARVYDVPWADDFAAARNAALDRATGGYVFWLDADDRLDEPNRDALRKLFATLTDEPAAYSMKCRCVSAGGDTVVDHVRLFPLRPDVRWEFRVHEQVLPSLRRAGVPVRPAAVVIDHLGYRDDAVRLAKRQRDLKLLEHELADRPGHPFALFNLGSLYHELGRDAEALGPLTRSLEASHPRDSIVRKLYALIARCHHRLGNLADATGAAAAGLAAHPDDAELLFLTGTLAEAAGNSAAAEAAYRRLVDGSDGDHFASVDPALRGGRGRVALGRVLARRGRGAEAEAEWRRAVADDPTCAAAWRELGERAAARGDAAATAKAVAALPPPAAAALLARLAAAGNDFATALAHLTRGLAVAPADLDLRAQLAEVLVREGRDRDGTERALRAVLELSPNHPIAAHNLQTLLAERDADEFRPIDVRG